MEIQQFAWDSTKYEFYYINHHKKGYVVIKKSESPEIYNFLMGVYCVHLHVIEESIKDYEKCVNMRELALF